MAEGWRGIRFTIRSDMAYLEPIRTIVRECTGLLGFEESEGDEVVLAVQEACTNVIRHCYKECPKERIDFRITFGDQELEIQIIDYGAFVDPTRIKSRDLDDVRPGGLGVHLMRKVMDEVIYERNESGGTTLTLRRRVMRPAADAGGRERLG